MSDMLNAFVEQTYDPYGGVESYEEKCREVVSEAKNKHLEWTKEAEVQLGRSQDISDYITILSNLKQGELDATTESHPNFSNYDHSLEADRLDTLREKYNYIPPEPSIVELSEMQIEPDYICENANMEEAPNLNGIFDDVFSA